MTKKLTRGHRPTLHLPVKKTPAAVAARLALPAPDTAASPEIDAAGKTRLSKIMRELSGRCPDPEKAIILVRYADQLDLTVFSLGRQSGFESLRAYMTAKAYYEETAGVPYTPQK